MRIYLQWGEQGCHVFCLGIIWREQKLLLHLLLPTRHLLAMLGGDLQLCTSLFSGVLGFFFWVQVLQFPFLICTQTWETPSLGKWHLQPDLSTLSSAAPPSLRHQVFIFSPFLPSKVPNSSVPSIKVSGCVTHMIKIKANNSPCILSYVASHLAGPGTQLFPEQS